MFDQGTRVQGNQKVILKGASLCHTVNTPIIISTHNLLWSRALLWNTFVGVAGRRPGIPRNSRQYHSVFFQLHCTNMYTKHRIMDYVMKVNM